MQEHRPPGVVETAAAKIAGQLREYCENASWQVIPSRELVPGDHRPCAVPATLFQQNVKLLTGGLSVDQSKLSLVSRRMLKKRPTMYSRRGPVVRRGEGNGRGSY